MNLFITRSADLRGLMDRAGRMNSPLAALLPPIAAGHLTLALALKRDGPVSMTKLRAIRTPLLVLLGDDDDQSTGPAGWVSATNLVRWASGIVVHGAAGEAAHYSEAAIGAMITGRALMIETDSAHLPAWVTLAGDKLRMAVVPKGGVHPVYPDRGAMH